MLPFSSLSFSEVIGGPAFGIYQQILQLPTQNSCLPPFLLSEDMVVFFSSFLHVR
jgi:hypothetical protein